MADGDAAQDRLRSFIERIERLEEEKAELGAQEGRESAPDERHGGHYLCRW